MRALSLLTLAVLALALAGLASTTLRAQQDEEAEKSAFVRYVEDTISTPDRRISLGTIEGALSSDVRISSITIADREGVWLRIEDAHLIWSRLALLRGRLEIDLLEAQSIAVLRRPLPAEGLEPAASSFELPDLPVSIRIDRLQVPVVSLPASIAGEDTVLSVSGSGRYEDASLNVELAVERTQPTGGRLFVKAAYSDASRQLELDLSLEEPQNGLLSNLLDLPGRPALSFSIKGSGPVDNFAADVGLSADGDQLLTGRATLNQGEAGLNFSADLSGSLGRLVPPAYADFFAGTSTLSIATRRLPGGGIALERATVSSGVLSADITATLSPDLFPTRIDASGRLGAQDGRPVLIPGAGGATVDSTAFSIRLAEGGWTGTFDLESLSAGSIRAETATIRASGEAENLADAATRRLTFTVDGRAEGLSSEDEALARALGTGFDLAARGSWQAGQPVAVEEIRFGNPNATARFVGRIDGNRMIGTYSLAAPDLSVLSGLVGSDLSGAVDLTARGEVGLVGGAFSLELDGTAENLGTGTPALDGLLAGRLALDGAVSRDTQGLTFRGLELSGEGLEARINGTYGTRQVSLEADVRLPDVGRLTDRASGAARATARLSRSSRAPDIALQLAAPRLDLQGKILSDASARFDGTLGREGPSGTLALSGSLAGTPVAGQAEVSSAADGAIRVEGLDARAGGSTLSGTLTLRADGLAEGRLALDAPDLATIAPLLLIEASGSLSATIGLSAENGQQNAEVSADARRLAVETLRVGSARIDARGQDIFGVPAIEGTATATDVQSGGFVLRRLEARAESAGGGATRFEASADLARGRAAASGQIRPASPGFDVVLDQLNLTQNGIRAGLAAPVTLASRPDGVTISQATLRLSQGGTVTVEGRVGETLDLRVALDRLPAALANLASAELGASGTLSGRATVGGTTARPSAEFTLTGRDLSAAALRTAGVPPLQLEANGTLADEVATVEASLRGGGLSATASGRIPLTGDGLAVSVRGSVPLALANAALAGRGARVAGTARIDARITGSLSAPRIDGGIDVTGASFNDPDTGTRLSAISGRIAFAGDRLRIERLSARTEGNGTVSVTGSVALSGEFPADLAIALRNARVSDGRILVAELSGDLRVTGPILGEPTLSGRIRVNRAEITIPERFARNAALLGVKHLAPPPEVRRTLARVRRASSPNGEEGSVGGIRLDLVVSAPSRIFVRGRGIDAELGGEVRLTGPISDVSPVGAFRLRRGAINVIGQRITLDSGEVRLEGDLDPTIDFVATTRTRTLVVTARVTGRASDPEIVLSSAPELPQDEVLAQFLFGNSINDLSPFQVVQLATAVAQLAGGSGGDLLSSIRKSTGLDTLSITTDARGNAAVEAGRYISRRVYLGVTTGAAGQTNATINLDITRNLKARAEAGTGGTGAGIYYEREY